MNLDKPWMSKAEIELIKKYLTTDKIMLEYGCGGSTTYFPQYVKEYYSIEHDIEWFHKVKSKTQNLKNLQIFNIPKNSTTKNVVTARDWFSLDISSKYKDFYDYIRFPQKLNIKFDIVLIDGRARPECAKFISDFLNHNAIVFIHDYWLRKHYHVVEEKYTVIDAIKNGQSIVSLKAKE